MKTPLTNIREYLQGRLRVDDFWGKTDIANEVYVFGRPQTEAATDPPLWLTINPAGGAGLAPNARGTIGIGAMRVDLYCYAANEGVAYELWEAVDWFMRDITPSVEGLLSCTVSGGGSHHLNATTRQSIMFGSYIVQFVPLESRN